MWGGLFEKGKELGSKAKGFVQQFGDDIVQQQNNNNANPFQAFQVNKPTNDIKKSPNPSPIPSASSIDILFSSEDPRETRLKGLVEKVTQLLRKLSDTQSDLSKKRTDVSEEMKEKINSTISQIVLENQNKFIGKVKQILIGRISSRITLQIEEVLGSEFTEDHKTLLASLFSTIDNEEISIFDSEFNVESLQTHFFSAFELEQMKESLAVSDQVNHEMKQIIETHQAYLNIEKQDLLNSLKKSEETLKDKSVELATALEFNKSLEMKAKLIKEDSLNLQKQIKEIQSNSEIVVLQLKQVRDESAVAIKKQEKTIKSLEDEKVQLEKDLDDAYDMNRVLEKDIFSLRNSTLPSITATEKPKESILSEEPSKNQEEISGLKLQLEKDKLAYESDLTTLRRQIEEINNYRIESDKRIEQLNSEIDSLADQRVIQENLINQTHQDTLKQIKQEKEQQLSQLQDILDQVQREKTLLEKDIEGKQVLQQELLVESKCNSEKILSELQEKLTTLTKEKSLVDEEVRRLKERHDKTIEERKQMTEKLKEEFNQLKSSLGNQDGNSAVNEIEKLNNERLTLTEQLQDSSASIVDLQSQLSHESEILLEFKEKYSKLETQVQNLEEELVENKNKLSESQSKDLLSQQNIAGQTQELDDLKRAIEQLKQEQNQKQLELQQLKQKLEQNDSLAEKQRIELENAISLSKSATDNSEKAEENERLKTELVENLTELSQLNELLETTKDSLVNCEQKLKEQKQNLVELKEERNILKEEQTQQLKQLQIAQQTMFELQQKLDSHSNESSGKLQEEQSRRVATEKQLEQQLIRIQEQSQEEIQSLMYKSENESAALQKATANLVKCESELAKTQSELSAASKKVEQSKQHIDQLRRGNKELLNIMIDHVIATANEMDKTDISKQTAAINESIKTSNPEIIKEFQRFLSESRKCFVDQYFFYATTIKNSEKVKFAKLSEQLDKSADEIKALNVKIKQLDKLEKQLLDVNEIIRLQKAQIKKSEDAFRDVQIELSSKEAQFNNIHEDVGQLQAKYEAITAENSFLKENSTRLQQTLNVITSEKIQLEEKLLESCDTGTSSREKDSQIAELEANLTSLSNVHEEFQRRSDTLARKYDAELKKMRAENAELKERCQLGEEFKLQIEQSENMITEKNAKITLLENKYAESEAERLEIRSETNNLLNKMKAESVKSEFLIDRRVISNFLVQYFDTDSSNQVKLQILDTMSQILLFSDDEKVKVGVQKQKLGFLTQQAMQQKDQPKGFANKFISFLLAPDDEQPKK